MFDIETPIHYLSASDKPRYHDLNPVIKAKFNVLMLRQFGYDVTK